MAETTTPEAAFPTSLLASPTRIICKDGTARPTICIHEIQRADHGSPPPLDPVLWAQRSSVSDATKNYVYLTLNVPDVDKSDLKLDLKPGSLTFTGASRTLKRNYHVELVFYADIDTQNSVTHHTGKNIELKLQKKDLGEEYWPRLLKDAKKVHFLKTDFDKWVDEDEQNEAPEEDFSQFGGMGGDFGGIDFSKLGGEGGMPDLSAMGAGADDADSGDDDEDDMPELEGDKA
ncbi:Protein wos2 [Escovopsis weberi]|uniref:Protein wos2 n=1 Tax=Escovopsis weberi TaxID=150374 RepID=A0A0M8MZ97_ESCWE|nr:Protein wos2 [Escovopsis weberi]